MEAMFTLTQAMHIFEKEISNHFRLICRWDRPCLIISLFNLREDTYYRQTYTNETLPSSVTQTIQNSTVDHVFLHIKTLCKVFQIASPGEIIMYNLRREKKKSLTFKLNKVQMNINPALTTFLAQIKKELFLLKDVNNQNAQIINTQDLYIETLRNQVKTKNEGSNITDSTPVKDKHPTLANYTGDDNQQRKVRAYFKSKEINNDWGNPLQMLQDHTSQVPTQFAVHELQQRRLSKKQKKQQAGKREHVQKISFQVDRKCLHFFRYTHTPSSAEKAISTDSYQLYSDCRLEEGIVSFEMCLEQSKQGNLIVGVITEENQQYQSSSFRRGSICYDGYYGIVINNSQEDGGRFRRLKARDCIQTIVDLENNRISWLINGTKEASTEIPEKMKLPLFPYFQLFDKGDIVTFCPEDKDKIESKTEPSNLIK